MAASRSVTSSASCRRMGTAQIPRDVDRLRGARIVPATSPSPWGVPSRRSAITSQLVAGGILEREQRGRRAWFRLRPQRLLALADALSGHRPGP
ncbi:hypothetical protein BN381_30032 [Candidatus Microthrix parvicella RN1]|uniref:HTH arsR-type domain-containing protein n=1 Tax=Candidatus Neomicrothrix parvicella RN1 TaxID=1229780 RepID=R4Z3J1_9ACTN|nr:hypothetical protein BN381_30032 [Candidatus Microthrix parvicella RN1]